MLSVAGLSAVVSSQAVFPGMAYSISTSGHRTTIQLGPSGGASITYVGDVTFTQAGFVVRDSDGPVVEVVRGPWIGSVAVTRHFRAGDAPDKWVAPGTSFFQPGSGTSASWNSPYSLCSFGSEHLAVVPNLEAQSASPFVTALDGLTIGPCLVHRSASGWQAGPWKGSAKVSYFFLSFKASDPAAAKNQVRSMLWRHATQWRRAKSDPQFVPFQIAVKETCEFNARPEEMSLLHAPGDIAKPQGLRWTTDQATGFGHPALQKQLNFRANENALRAAWGLYAWGKAKKQTSWMARAESLVSGLLANSPSETFAGSIDLAGAHAVKPAGLSDQAATANAALDYCLSASDSPHRKALLDRAKSIAESAAEQNEVTPEMAELLVRSPETGVDLIRDRAVLARVHETIANRGTANLGARLKAASYLAKRAPENYKGLVETLVSTALDLHCLWDRPSDPQAPTFGTFGSEFGTRADSPEISVALIRLGVLYDNPEWVDRGAFGVRAMFGLWSSSFGRSGLPVEREVPHWQAVPAMQPGGFSPRTSWEGGEGRYVALLREVIESAGGRYTGANGTVGIDGCALRPDGLLGFTLSGASTPSFARFLEPGLGSADAFELKTYPAISSLVVDMATGSPIVVASPGMSMPQQSLLANASFSAGGKSIPAKQVPLGLQATGIALPAKVTVTGKYENVPFRADRFLSFKPMLSVADVFPFGWRRFGDTSHVFFSSLTTVSTADTGQGTSDPGLTGRIVSKEFCGTGLPIRFDVSGTSDCTINLVEANTNTKLYTWSPRPGLSVKTQFVAPSSMWLQVELEDNSRTGWIAVKPTKT